jgi:hypothetical protein
MSLSKVRGQFFKLYICIFFATPLLAQKPKLVVGVVVDQMCYEYLYRFQHRFSKNGFNKLISQGTHCRNTQYNYVPTFTGPGHASIYTGTTPSNHGIVANEWYDRDSKKDVYCVQDTTVVGVGADSKYGKRSPVNLYSNTITDQLKLTYPNSKVISLSIKDRSSILPGGHLSDGSYWYDYKSGNFISSTFFMKNLPTWVENFNNRKQVDAYLEQTWNTFYPLETYKTGTEDNSPYEELLKGKTTPTFPYNLKEMTGASKDYNLFTYTPFSNTLLTDLSLEALKNEKLGQRGESDFLCISYSTPDIAGHAFGPYSVEIEDIYIRLDLEIARLLAELEKTLGKDNFVFFITADHAVVPVPQYLVDRKLPGGYFYVKPNMENLRKKIQQNFGFDFVLENDNNNIYLNRPLLAERGVLLTDAQYFIKQEVASWNGVKRVFTSNELENQTSDDEWQDMVRLGYKHHLSGDVIYLLEPGYLPKSSEKKDGHKGTSHGSAFNYDTHVPLIWYGGKIPAQDIFRRVDIIDISATLVHILNLQKPNSTTGEPILELLNNMKKK